MFGSKMAKLLKGSKGIAEINVINSLEWLEKCIDKEMIKKSFDFDQSILVGYLYGVALEALTAARISSDYESTCNVIQGALVSFKIMRPLQGLDTNNLDERIIALGSSYYRAVAAGDMDEFVFISRKFSELVRSHAQASH